MSKTNDTANESKPLTKGQRKQLFAEYKDATVTLLNAEQGVVETRLTVGHCVQNIAEQIGNGPFRFEGEEISVGKRGETYFMKRRQAREVVEI